MDIILYLISAYFIIGVAAFLTIIIAEQKDLKEMIEREGSIKVTIAILVAECLLLWPALLKEELFPGKK
jgi:hypothetical protein